MSSSLGSLRGVVRGKRIVLAASMFLISLQTYYFYELGVAPFPLLGLALLAGVAFAYSPRGFLGTMTTSCKLLLGLPIALVVLGMLASISEELSILPARLLTPIVALTAALSIQVVVTRDPSGLMLALRLVVIAHLAFFLLQFFVYLATGYMIDFLAPITGEEQRVWSGDYSTPIMSEFARCSGLFNEPGTYVNFVFPSYLAMRALMEEHGDDHRWGWVDVLVIATVILSFSIFGILFLLVWVLGGLVLRFSMPKLLLGIAAVVVAWVVAGDYVLQRFAHEGGDAGGLGFRAEIFGKLFEGMSADRFFWGYGFLSDLSNVFADLVLNDVGLVIYTFIVGGAYAVILLLSGFVLGVVLAPRERSPLPLVVLASKLSLTSPFFWILAFIVAAPSRRRV